MNRESYETAGYTAMPRKLTTCLKIQTSKTSEHFCSCTSIKTWLQVVLGEEEASVHFINQRPSVMASTAGFTTISAPLELLRWPACMCRKVANLSLLTLQIQHFPSLVFIPYLLPNPA